MEGRAHKIELKGFAIGCLTVRRSLVNNQRRQAKNRSNSSSEGPIAAKKSGRSM